MSELKSCPFCGSNPEIKVNEQNWDSDYFEGEIISICCVNDDCMVSPMALSDRAPHLDWSADKDQAIERWNTRTESTELEQLRKERDELKAFVKELSEEPVVTVTTPTGRFGGDEDTNYINDWWIDDAKDLLAKLNQQGE